MDSNNNQKTYIIRLEGLSDSIKEVETLSSVLKSLEKEYTSTVKTKKSVEDSSKSLASMDESYRKELERQKVALQSQRKELQEQVKAENALQTIEAGVMDTYRDKQKMLSALGTAIKTMTVSTEEDAQRQDELKQRYAALNAELKDFDASMGNYQRSVGNYAIAGQSLRGELRELQQQMATMLAEGVSPSDSAFVQLAQRAGQLKDAMNDAAQAVSKFSSDSRSLDQVISIGQTLTGVYGTVRGTMALFGEEGEALAQTFVKLQGVMTVLNSLQALQNTLNTEGTLANTLYNKAMSALGLSARTTTGEMTALSGATVAQTAATTGATAATTALRVALAAIGIGLIVSAIAALISNWEKIKNYFTETIPILGSLSDTFNKVKDVVIAIGETVISKLLNPVKTAIGTIQKLVKGDLKGAFETAVEGIREQLDLAGTFQENYEERVNASNERLRLKNIENKDDELQKEIEINEAKYGSDWKYTQDGQALYAQHFANLAQLYEGDAEKYHALTIKKLNYERELTNNQKKENDKQSKNFTSSRNSILKAEQENAKKLKKEWESLIKDINKYVESGNDDILKSIEKRLDDEVKAIKDRYYSEESAMEDSLKRLEEIEASKANIIEMQNRKTIDDEETEYNELYDRLTAMMETYVDTDATKYAELLDEREALTRTHLERISALEIDAQKEMDNLHQQFIDDREALEKNYYESQRDDVKKQLDSLTTLMDEEFKAIKGLDWDAIKIDGYLFDWTNLDKTREKYQKNIEQMKKAADDWLGDTPNRATYESLWDDYLDYMKKIYGEDSKEYLAAQKEKESAMNTLATNTMSLSDDIADKEQEDADLSEKSWIEMVSKVAAEIEKFQELVMDPVFEAVGDLLQSRVDEAQAYYDKVSEAHEQAVDKVKESEDRIAEIQQEMIGARGGNVAQLQQDLADEQALLVQRQQDEEALNQEEIKAQEDLNKEETRLKKEQAAEQLIQATIDTASGVAKTLGAYPWPLNLVLSAIVAAAGAVEIATIASNMSKYAEGGYLDGPSHKDGGMRVEGTNIEVEGGEFVINKKSTEKYQSLIESINRDDRQGIVSALSAVSATSPSYYAAQGVTTWGVDGVGSVGVDYSSMLQQADEASENAEVVEAINNSNERPIYVAVTEYEKVSSRLARVREYGG